MSEAAVYHGTTIVSVRRQLPDGRWQVALGGDGQVTLGHIVVKASARKVRKLHKDQVLAGFAGATADAFTLFERFEAKLEKHQGHLARAAIELTRDWRTDRVLRRLEAMLAVACWSPNAASWPSARAAPMHRRLLKPSWPTPIWASAKSSNAPLKSPGNSASTPIRTTRSKCWTECAEAPCRRIRP